MVHSFGSPKLSYRAHRRERDEGDRRQVSGWLISKCGQGLASFVINFFFLTVPIYILCQNEDIYTESLRVVLFCPIKKRYLLSSLVSSSCLFVP